MQRSNKIMLPPKAKTQDEIDGLNQLEDVTSEENQFFETTYHQKPWLFCLFGNKDGTSDPNYLGLKSEIAAFASELYRLCTHGHNSPKYRSVFNNTTEPTGFITEKINNTVSLTQVFELLDLLKNKAGLFWGPWASYDFIGQNIETYFENLQKNLLQWYKESIKRMEKNLDPFKNVVDNHTFNTIKNCFYSFLTQVKNEGFYKLKNDEIQYKSTSKSFSLENTNHYLQQIYATKLDQCYITELTPIRKNIIKSYTKYLYNALPEIMAVGYALGEWSFKARDIVFSADTHKVYKLDHERCLWEISYTLLEDLQSVQAFSNSKNVITQQSISSHDIDHFPKRTNPPRFWPGSEDDHHYPDWFLELFNQSEFKFRSYVSFLAFACTPNSTIQALCKLFFKSVYSENIADHVIQRKICLEKALKHSTEFTYFLSSLPEEKIFHLFKAHNIRWYKEKYADLKINLKLVTQNLAALKTKSKQKETEIDLSINHIYTIKPPHLK